MTQKQYEVGQVIMQMSRIFAKAMAECMKNSGLVDEGYVLSVRVQEGYKIDPGYTLTGSVTLEPKELGITTMKRRDGWLSMTRSLRQEQYRQWYARQKRQQEFMVAERKQRRNLHLTVCGLVAMTIPILWMVGCKP